MSQDDGTQREAPSHSAYFEGAAVSARRLQRMLAALPLPDHSHRTVARVVFDGRASRYTVKAWRIGKRYVPEWARDLLREKAAKIIEAANEMPTGPGMQAGWRNVSGYRANR